MPDGRIDDGLLDVALIQARGPLGWLSVWRKLWWDNSVLRKSRLGRRLVATTRNQSIRYLVGAEAEAASPDPQSVELDGDEYGLAARIRCRVRSGRSARGRAPRSHRRPLTATALTAARR